jgi:hypothetical protein
MKTTRGNTEMERLILGERLMAIDSMSKELESLKIRYGELVAKMSWGLRGEDWGRNCEETVGLR